LVKELAVDTSTKAVEAERKAEEAKRKAEAANRNFVILSKAIVGALVVFLLLAVFMHIYVGPTEAADKNDLFEASASAVQVLSLIIGGVVAYFTAYTAWRENTKENLQLQRDRDITEHYTRAVEQLGHDKRDIRLGGIHALERIATDSEKDERRVMNLLTSYIQNHAPWPSEAGSTEEDSERPPQQLASPAKHRLPDVQAILTMLGRGPLYEGEYKEIDLRGTDLQRADLRNAYLKGAEFEGANLQGASIQGAFLQEALFYLANLCHADLRYSNLERADLRSADLSSVNMSKANLKDAKLANANLSNATLSDTSLAKADLNGAQLSEVDLRGADLIGVKSLTQEQVEQAIGDQTTQLPDHLQPPKAWDNSRRGLMPS